MLLLFLVLIVEIRPFFSHLILCHNGSRVILYSLIYQNRIAHVGFAVLIIFGLEYSRLRLLCLGPHHADTCIESTKLSLRNEETRIAGDRLRYKLMLLLLYPLRDFLLHLRITRVAVHDDLGSIEAAGGVR